MVNEFKTFYLSNARATFQKLYDVVWEMRGGAENGELWDANVNPFMKWQDFLTATTPTLRKMDKAVLVKATFDLDTVP